ncbi:hypothetical protein BpHYR1_035370 [Brachionus plicatilis]|uniref:Uncharacterized protein n=1 Tax=Brachionus plicatilis TaxID=10195 RepID=A0A3M7S8E0_BRAPC|nr:hypothetical protein BpHYR1_035370 [Brachionus plicatilis]
MRRATYSQEARLNLLSGSIELCCSVTVTHPLGCSMDLALLISIQLCLIQLPDESALGSSISLIKTDIELSLNSHIFEALNIKTLVLIEKLQVYEKSYLLIVICEQSFLLSYVIRTVRLLPFSYLKLNSLI